MAKVLLYIAISYSIALFVLSLVNLKELSDIEVNNIDKLFHGTAYCGLVIVWYLYHFMSTKNKFKFAPLFYICLFAVIFGIIIEILQGSATDYRTEDVYDMMANFSGTLIAFLLIVLMKNVLERWKMKFNGILQKNK